MRNEHTEYKINNERECFSLKEKIEKLLKILNDKEE